MPISAAPLQLTEKLLIDAGGWDAIRHARGIRESGRVSGANWVPPMLQGFVREGERELRSGLKIVGPSNVENICTCRASREFGTICAHSLAVGLSVLGKEQISPQGGPVLPAGAPSAAGKGPFPAAGKTSPPLPYRADADSPARLHVVLAPDLAAAWTKNQLLFGLEVATGGKRGMFGAPGINPGHALIPEDHRVIEAFHATTDTVPGGMSFLDRKQFLALLPALTGHPRLALGKAGSLTVSADALRPPLRGTFNPDGSLQLAVRLPEGSRLLLGEGRAYVLRPGVRETTLQPLAPGLPAPYLSLFDNPPRLPADQAAAFLNLEWPKLEPFFELRADNPPPPAAGKTGPAAPGSPALAHVEPGTPQWTLSIEGSLTQLGARMQAVYPNKRVVSLGVTPERDIFTYPPPGAAPGTLHTRNQAAERATLGRLISWGFHGPDTGGHYFLRGEDHILRFFALGLPDWQREPGWQVTVGSRFQSISKQIEIIKPEVSVRGSGEDWFEMELSLTGSSGERFSAVEIQRLLQMGSGHTRLRNGKLAILPADTLSDLQAVLRDCDPSQTQPGVYRLQQAQGEYIAGSLERWEVATAPSWQQWQARRERFQQVAEPVLPAALTGTLRPYQHEGVRWLHLLATNRLGGILADEMGLGKTLQALAYLASARLRPPKTDGRKPAIRKVAPALIVCPTSLVDNWRREAAKFTPDLRTLPIDGPDRATLFAKIPDSDLVITSYALLRRDLERYRAHHFAAVVLDEAHHIKNPDSQVAMAACSLHSDQRFVLTGTPMENSVRDLWSIMHFALPGYLGNRQDFRERYELPLSRPGEPTADAVRERLTRRLRPVLLRRLKRDVAKDLPARIEQTSFCDLTPAQAQVYQQILAQSRLKLDAARNERNKGQGRMLVLTSLLRLRQACCDLRLLGLNVPNDGASEIAGQRAPLPRGGARKANRRAATPCDVLTQPSPASDALQPEDAPASSGKLALLDELLEEIREGGHRVLIFSQFVSMLGLLRAHLDSTKTSFCYLDGSTKPKDRASEVERFQTDERVTAFLISVKAGGVGLNLTGADTVIHFDPWWNPAVEAQATDRAHRIGQTKVVTAYRLIARNTVEEKIFALQNRKRELTASLVERESDEPLLETLSFDEIESLLE